MNMLRNSRNSFTFRIIILHVYDVDKKKKIQISPMRIIYFFFFFSFVSTVKHLGQRQVSDRCVRVRQVCQVSDSVQKEKVEGRSKQKKGNEVQTGSVKYNFKWGEPGRSGNDLGTVLGCRCGSGW